MNIFDLLITGSGLYLLYAAVALKVKKQITKGVMVSKDVDVERIRDKEGFIQYMFPKVLLMGLFTVGFGMTNLLGARMHWPSWVSIVAIVAYLLTLIGFSALTMKAGNKFV